jgi:ABC-type multidrug transport system ATPase subunit
MPDSATRIWPAQGSLETPPAPPLCLERIEKRWGASAPVLAGIDLALEPGVTAAVVGANGAGKTTLLRIIAGVLVPDTGSVRVYGIEARESSARYRSSIGFLSAGNGGLYGRLKAEHHLELWTRLALMPRRLRAPATSGAIEAFGLQAVCGRRVDRLSAGERQRLRLALAFVHQPTLVLLDEPTTSLDERGLEVLETALVQLKSRGGSALICLPTGWRHPLTIDSDHALDGGRLEPR